MTTLTDLGVTQSKLRAYGHDGKFEALTGPQLQGICCYLKAHLDKKEGKFKRWSKGVQKEMRGIGITQDQRSGEPCINYRKAKVVENISVSLEDFNRVEDELQAAKEEIQAMKDLEVAIEAAKEQPVINVSEDLMKAEETKPKRTRRTKASEPKIRTLNKKEFLEEGAKWLISGSEDYIKAIEDGQKKAMGTDYWNVMDPKPEVPSLADAARQTKEIHDQGIANNSISDPVKPKRTRRTKAQIEADKNK